MRAVRNPKIGPPMSTPVLVLAHLVNAGALVQRGLAPTGQRGVDACLVVALGVGWLAAAVHAPWWSMAAVGALGAVAAGSPLGAAAGLVAFLAAIWLGVGRRPFGMYAVVAGGCGVQSLARMTAGRWFGMTAAVALLAAASVVMAAAWQWSTAGRRRARATLGLVVSAILLSLIGLAASSASAKPSLEDANSTIRRAFRALEAGDAQDASGEFDAASRIFDRIARELDQPWTQPSRLLPVVAQHHDSVARLSAGAARLSNDLSVVLKQIDPAALNVSGGHLDMVRLRTVNEPVARLEHSLVEFDQLLTSVESSWLVGPLQRALHGLHAEVERSHEAAVNLKALVAQLPDMLGASGPRKYFVGFITPAEARGLGGFMGNYAEITADRGTVEMTAFGRVADLRNGAVDPSAWTLDLSREFSARYGDFGFDEPDTRTVSPDIWSNITMSPDLPSVAPIIAQLYPQSGGSEIDGVIMLDPSAMAALMELTGPITLPTREAPLTAAEAEDYIVRAQYEIDAKDGRIDALEVLARSVMDGLLGGDLPGPWKLSRLMGPILARDGMMLWSKHPAEQSIYEQVGVSGRLPELVGRDGVSVVVNNASANKIDAYLLRSVKYRASVDQTRGVFKATATVTLQNLAPADGLASYVIGNQTEDPPGTNRTYLSMYTAFPVSTARLDGQPIAMEVSAEQGWIVSSAFIAIPPGKTRTVEVEMFGGVGANGYELVWRPQPSVLPTSADVVVTGSGGTELVKWVEPEARRDKIVAVNPPTN